MAIPPSEGERQTACPAARSPGDGARCAGGTAPSRAGRGPRGRVRPAFGLVLGIALLGVACAANQNAQVTLPVVVGISAQTAPLYDEGDTQIFQVTTQVPLPMRRPTDGERSTAKAETPFPRVPFLTKDDVRIEVRFTLSNLDDVERTVELLVDPWNEFARYEPGVVQEEEEIIPNPSGYDRYFVLPPKGRVEGVLTPDDTQELAVDLATCMSILDRPPGADAAVGTGALMNRAMNQQNRSSQTDPLLDGYEPPTIPGLTGFDLGLRAGAPMNVAVEVYADVVEQKSRRVVPPGKDDAPMGRPGRVVTPPAPARE